MTDRYAFVGHSFQEIDEAIVRVFLDYFDGLKNMGIGFNWDHAREAESKELATKVLEKIKDKNLFIGICTKKERVIYPERLKQNIFLNRRLSGDSRDYKWKTSDWIIQEIGLAIGRNLELMLLLEEGVEPPGGLQGNYEYIYFNRNSPEKSFKQINETIQNLLPVEKVGTAEAVSSSTTLDEPPETLNQDSNTELLEPQEEWIREDYEKAMARMFATDNKLGIRNISEAYNKCEEAKDPEAIASWEAYQEWLRIIFGKEGGLSKIKALANDHPDNTEVRRLLARSYHEYTEHERAADQYQLVAELESDNSKKLSGYSDAVNSLLDANRLDKITNIIASMTELASQVEDGEEKLLETLRKVSDKNSQMDRYFGFTEKLLQINPDNTGARFSIAYRYSQTGLDEASLFHYLKIPYQERHSSAWNNIGVEYDHFKMPHKSVLAYKKAEEKDGTLAMSNLANKLINVGFLVEAEKLCVKAQKIDDYHKNISESITRVKNIPGKEGEKTEEVLKHAEPISRFYKKYGAAILKDDAPNQVSTWKGPNGNLTVRIENGRFIAEGSYRKKVGRGLINAFAGIHSDKPPTPRIYNEKYEGIVEGYTANCSYTHIEEGTAVSAANTILGDKAGEHHILIIMSDAFQEMEVFDKGKKENQRFYKITIVEKEPEQE